MTSKITSVVNACGIHARPASLFVQRASGFESRVMVENLSKGGGPSDAKSILSVMGSGMTCGTEIRVSAEGPDEVEAVEALVAFVEGGCGE